MVIRKSTRNSLPFFFNVDTVAFQSHCCALIDIRGGHREGMYFIFINMIELQMISRPGVPMN